MAIRIGLSRLGYNYDFESWQLVADLTLQGKNVYAETYRYNYGPLFIWVFAALKFIFHSNFRTAVALVFSLTDVAIATILFKRGNTRAALLILFSPICMIISGYHNQIDNVSILIALLGVRYVETRKNYDSSIKGWGIGQQQTIVFAFLLGFSLIAKHILIFFPFWMLFHKRLFVWQKLMLFLFPVALFLASFLPYWSASQSIVANVFSYNPGSNAPIYNLLVGKPVIDLLILIFGPSLKPLFCTLLIFSGFFMRKKVLIEQLAFYYLLVVLFTSLLFAQYLIIPMLFFALFESRFWKWYNLIGLTYLIFNNNEANILFLFSDKYHDMIYYIECWGVYFCSFILLLALVDKTAPNFLHRKTFVNLIKRYL